MNRRSRTRALLAGLVSIAAAVSITSIGGTAHAESCTGTPMRTIVSDVPGMIENQNCLDGHWVTVSRWQIQPDTLVVHETVDQPQDTKFHLTAEAFFDLKNYDPYKIETVFRDVIEGGTKLSTADLTELLLKSARTDVQALLSRETRLNPNKSCQTRSRPAIWDGPEPFSLTPGGPKVITYALDPSLSTDEKVIILNTIAQYRPAVDTQDYVGKYPEDIVPAPPGPRPPTITFKSVDHIVGEGTPGLILAGHTKVTHVTLGLPPRIVTAEVELLDDIDLLNPRVVAHDIGHALGINHSPDDLDATMNSVARPVNAISPWDVRNSHNDSPAFDACMFLPME